MAEEVKLFGAWGSPYSRRIELALKLKGLQFEYIEEDLYNKSPALLKYNPVHKKVPVLVHNGKPVAESLVILEYIDETWKHNPFLPTDPYEKAKARFWARFIDEKFWPAAKKAMASREREREEAIEEAQQHLKTLESELKEKKIFGRESLGFVDIAAHLLVWLVVAQEAFGVEILTEEKFPAVHELYRRLADEAVFKECMPPKEQLIAYLKEAIEETRPHLKALESGLKERKFVGGESLGFVELAANVIKFPTVHEWYQRFADDAVFKECAPPRSDSLPIIKLYLEPPASK
ncbi:hypothetical protein AAG906_032279 [Vitis piasezkii]